VNSETYQLVVRKGPTPGQIFPLESDLITLGRDPLSDIVVDDPEVSRHHARLTLSAGTYLLQDRGSTNGSFVDGARLGGDPVQLKPGQVIMFGTTVTMVFQAIPAEDPMATVVAPAAAVSIEAPPVEEVPAAMEEPEELAPTPELEPPVEPVIEKAMEEEPSEPEVVFEMEAEEVEPELVELEDELSEMAGYEEELVTPEDEVDIGEILPSLEDDEQEEEEEEEEEEMATMIEPIPFQPPEEPAAPEPVVAEPEPPAMPVFDEPEPEPVELPALDEVEPDVLPLPEEPALDIELPDEPPPLEPLPSYDEPLPELEPEPSLETPIFGFERGASDPIIDSAAPMKDLESVAPEQPVIQTTGEVVEEKGSTNRNRNIIIGVVAFVVLCCLCIAVGVAAYFLIYQP